VVQALHDLGSGADAGHLVQSALPAELRRRLARPDLEVRGLAPAAVGGSAVVDIAGPALGAATVSLVLHGDGSRVTTALCAAGGSLPEELRMATTELDAGPFAIADTGGPPAERARNALASASHVPEEIPGDHRWWSEISGLLMLAELMNEG
jgi:hypothetical protein